VSKWANKYVIGLTGNIGTGKSVVRKMLEQLGAYGIDADALAHRAIAHGAPGFQSVIQTFGQWVVGKDGEIDRSKLAKIAFSDPEALALLEGIIHPLVGQAVELLVKRSRQKVIVIEAIKLIESGMNQWCDSLWVTYSPQEVQIERLVKHRNMKEDEARVRIAAQPSQEEKIGVAQVIIRNYATIPDLWKQVNEAWMRAAGRLVTEPSTLVAEVKKPIGEIAVLRGKPQHSAQIARLLNQIRKPGDPVLEQDDVLEAFGEKAFLLIRVGQELVGLIGWQVENLVARTLDLVIDGHIPANQALPVLINEMERASKELQCEVSLVFLSEENPQIELDWKKLGYEPGTPEGLSVQAWQEAAQETLKPGMQMYFKQLRVDRVLRPI
jgi:dephospho-CoA kinase